MLSAALPSRLELDPPHDPQLAIQAANDARLNASKEIADSAEPAGATVKKDSKLKAAPAAAVATPSSRWRQRAEGLIGTVLPPLLGLALLVGLWSIVSSTTGHSIPTPAETWTQAVEVFRDPFYRNGPNDQGVGWNVLSSLQRVALGPRRPVQV